MDLDPVFTLPDATRKEYHATLSCVHVRAIPTTATMDMGLEYDFITAQGAGSCLGTIGEWPLIRLRGIEFTQWTSIRRKAEEGTLCYEDVKGSCLDSFAVWMRQFHPDYFQNFANTFASLRTLPPILPDVFYCLFDFKAWSDQPEFYLTEYDLLDAFRDEYCWDIVPWDEMDDDTIDEWHGRLSDDLASTPFITFGFEDEEEMEE